MKGFGWLRKFAAVALLVGKHGARFIPVPFVREIVIASVDMAEATGMGGKQKKKMASRMVLNFMSLLEAMSGRTLFKNKKKLAKPLGALIDDFVTYRNLTKSWPKKAK